MSYFYPHSSSTFYLCQNSPKLLIVLFFFYPDHCVFQDHLTKKEIGRGHKKGGLYFLDVSTFVVAVITTSSTTWHARFGNPSSSALKCLAPVLGFNKNSCDHCEVCHLSKQTRFPFPLHTPTSSSLFELIHVDVWGKYATPTKMIIIIF